MPVAALNMQVVEFNTELVELHMQVAYLSLPYMDSILHITNFNNANSISVCTISAIIDAYCVYYILFYKDTQLVSAIACS